MREKSNKVRDRQYIAPGLVQSLIRYFAVPKGESDIRMVYDGTSSGFNDWVWAPSLGLPTIESMLRSVDSHYWLGDVDIGEQFLNFPLHYLVQAHCGVDLTKLFPEELEGLSKNKLWERWTRCLMGAKPSPYQACKSMLWAEDIVSGNKYDQSNPFHWSYAKINLPGTPEYDPNLPWIAKMRSDHVIATDVFIYVDDVRITGPSEEDFWKAIRKLSSLFGYLGIQDAPRKRRPPSTTPGAWAGSIVYLHDGFVGVYVDQNKWNKTKDHLLWLKQQIQNCQVNSSI